VSDAARMLDEFHSHPNVLGTATNARRLRSVLHQEEHRELMHELNRGNYPDRMKVARELADVVYVAYGTAWVFGIDLDAALREVHRAAMDKVRANCRRPDGKIVKHPGFVPPDMSEAVAA
jgi:predicted HAD superfamily Cof-like phosphohydrolase